MPFPTIARIETARLILRPALASDLVDLLEVNGDLQVTQFVPYPTWQSLDDGSAWLGRMDGLAAAGTGQQLVIERRTDSKVVGTLLLFKYDEGSRRVELGYVLRRSDWGNGLMREAVGSMCADAFDRLDIRRIEAEVNTANAASCRLLVNVGFALEGTLRKRYVAKGVVYDTNLYGYLADDRHG